MVAIPVTGNKGKEWMARGPVGLHVKVPCFFATHARFHHVPRTSLDGWSKSLDAMENRQNVVGDGRLAKGFGGFQREREDT